MTIVNMHEAKTHFSKIVDQACKGECTIIAKASKPVAKMVPLDEPTPKTMRRFNFMKGQIEVPADFDTIFQKEIEELFYGEE